MDKDGVVGVVRQAASREDEPVSGEKAVNGAKDAVAPHRCAVDDSGNKVCSD